jgi:CO/xanthine dehydrogenase Mo-binding subunit
MLHGAVAFAATASARLAELDLGPARAVSGVVAVLSAPDLPAANQVGVIFPDQELLVSDRIRMVGDRLALIAADSPEAAWAAARAVRPRLEDLPGVHDPVAALETESPTIHDSGNLLRAFQVVRGDLEEARARAKVEVEATYTVGGQEHAYLEPQGCLAIPEGRRITIVASCQCPFYIQHAAARVLGLPLASVRVEQALTGGGFGGKEDYPSEPAACAAVLAWHTKRPVRLVFSREVDLQVTSKRHAVVIHHHWGADADGRIVFAEVDTVVDAGAYAGLSTVVAERANVSAIGPYDVPVVKIRTRVAYTNNLFGGAFRGFGAPQVTWAGEATMDRLARALDLDPLEIRRRNVLDEERRVTCTGQELRSPVLARACLERAAELSNWTDGPTVSEGDSDTREGLGMSLVMYGCNLHHGGQRLDRSSAVVILQPDASVVVRVGVTEMGQGNLTACQTVAAEALGLAPERVEVWQPDTTTVADSGPTVASRGAHSSGMAILDAVRRLRERLDPVAAELLACEPTDVELAGGCARVAGQPKREVPLAQVAAEMSARRLETLATGWYRSAERRFDPVTGLGDPYAFYAFACHVARVDVDVDLGLIRPREVVAVHDVGTVIHRDAIEGQVEGGIVQAIGWAVSEDLRLDHGRLLNPNFTDYVIPTAADTPTVVMDLLESDGEAGPFGAKGIGEPSFIPTAAAVRNAAVAVLGRELDRLPMTPPEVVAAQGDRHRYAWVLDAVPTDDLV